MGVAKGTSHPGLRALKGSEEVFHVSNFQYKA